MKDVLVVYYSLHGSVRALADEIILGIHQVPAMQARLRTVPKVSAVCESTAPDIPADGPPYAEQRDVEECCAMIIGSPTRFGNMAAPMKYFLDGLITPWVNGSLDGKPGAVFTASASLHGGQESTLLSMMLPLLHQGMVITGLPFRDTPLDITTHGGTPYGPSHVSGKTGETTLTETERVLARQLGERVARIAKTLDSPA